MLLGAGRARVDSRIDPAVGVILHKKVGDRVEAGEPLCTVLVNDQPGIEDALAMIGEAYRIGRRARHPTPFDPGTDVMAMIRWFAVALIVLGPAATGLAQGVRVEQVAPTRVEVIPPVLPVERFQSALGIVAILALVTLLSTDRRAISRRVVIWGLVLQWAFALVVLRVPLGRRVLARLGDVVEQGARLRAGRSAFVFGDKLTSPRRAGRVRLRVPGAADGDLRGRAVRGAVSPGVMQWFVRVIAIGMERLMGASGAESLNVAASLFLGQTEAPLTIRPYLPKLTRSELLTVMTSGMAHVSGGVMAAYFAYGVEPRHILTAVIMTAPGTILLSKMLIPETEMPETGSARRGSKPVIDELIAGEPAPAKARPDAERPDANLLDAASRGTREGLATRPEHRGDADLVPGPDRPGQQGLELCRDVAPADLRLDPRPGGVPPGGALEPTARRSAGCWGPGRSSTS